MKVVLDTNVLVSGIFFSGPPAAILKAWSRGKIRMMVSPEILDEYKLDLIVVHSEVCDPPSLPLPVCEDPSDDKFLSVAIETRT